MKTIELDVEKVSNGTILRHIGDYESVKVYGLDDRNLEMEIGYYAMSPIYPLKKCKAKIRIEIEYERV